MRLVELFARSIQFAALLLVIIFSSFAQGFAQDFVQGEEIEDLDFVLEREALAKIFSKEQRKNRHTLQSLAVNEADSLALITLYNATDGPNWTDSENWTTGEVSTWKGITVNGDRVTEINLSWNQLDGALPDELANLTSLTSLSMSGGNLGQDFTLPVPDFLFELPELTNLSLSSSKFGGTLPVSIGSAPKLKVITLSNNEIGGDIPVEIAASTTITQLWLTVNKLTGSPPQELQNMTQLLSLFLASNQLSGEFPAWVSTMTQLTQLSLNRNEFTGTIPSELGDLVNLFVLSIGGGNLMTGTIPDELSQLTRLSALTIDDIDLTGELPSWLIDLTSLSSINFRNSGLSGELPPNIGDLVRLRTIIIDGGGTNLTGSIPPSLGDLPNLDVLWLGGNNLSGEIPKELGQLSNLTRLNLDRNDLTGTLPLELGNMTSMQWMSLSDNRLYSEIPAELANLTEARQIRLDRNVIWGIVPIEFATRGAEMDVVQPSNGCSLISNHSSLCIPNTGDYAALGVDMICGLELQASCPITAVDVETDTLPEELSLSQNYPNPFNPSTSIKYQLSTSSEVLLTVTNDLGQKVLDFDLGRIAAGQHQFDLDMHDLPSGLYFYTIATDFGLLSKQMNLIK